MLTVTGMWIHKCGHDVKQPGLRLILRAGQFVYTMYTVITAILTLDELKQLSAELQVSTG